jgi:hypothetical protein
VTAIARTPEQVNIRTPSFVQQVFPRAIALSYCRHRIIALSPSYYRIVAIAMSHHRTVVIALPHYRIVVIARLYCCHRTIALSLSGLLERSSDLSTVFKLIAGGIHFCVSDCSE